jgi:hypothetical protein
MDKDDGFHDSIDGHTHTPVCLFSFSLGGLRSEALETLMVTTVLRTTHCQEKIVYLGLFFKRETTYFITKYQVT